jgi:hypothetical protein
MNEISKKEKWVNYALLIFFAALAFYCAQKATAGLFLPADDDTFRDMAIAENIKYGQAWKDPSYLNELLWYNPGVPALEACISWLTGMSLNMVLTQAGKYINLVIPFMLYFLGSKLFDKRIAFGAGNSRHSFSFVVTIMALICQAILIFCYLFALPNRFFILYWYWLIKLLNQRKVNFSYY